MKKGLSSYEPNGLALGVLGVVVGGSLGMVLGRIAAPPETCTTGLGYTPFAICPAAAFVTVGGAVAGYLLLGR